MNIFCCDARRRGILKGSGLNGIDFLEVVDRDATTVDDRQHVLLVHFVNPAVPPLTREQVRIEGGERIRNLAVESVVADAPGVLRVRVSEPGDFSTYTLRLVSGPLDDAPPPAIDALFAAVEFSFKVECPSDFDCRLVRDCPRDVPVSPEIDYLARDYATLRRLMLDRMAAIMPQWQERNPADLGIALVEMLAYVGDHFSYQQDALATEAYLGTARKRVSVRRHARMVDYLMHDGSNARTWLHVTVEGTDHVLLPAGTAVLSSLPQQPPRLPPESLPRLLRQDPIVFETMTDALLFPAHNELHFHTWGNERCCLPRGATRATLRDDPRNRLRLRAGDILVFEEKIGPLTGLADDADPQRRHAVRLTSVTPEAESERDESGNEIDRIAPTLIPDPLAPDGVGVVEIEWAAEDALPLPFCLSSVTDETHGSLRRGNVSVATGNIVSADHGRTLVGETVGLVPPPVRFLRGDSGGDRCVEPPRIPVPARFNPSLSEAPLTQAAPLADGSAAEQMLVDTADTLPAVTLTGELDSERLDWRPRRDLLDLDPSTRAFVVEVEHDGRVAIRFGDGEHGRRPEPGMRFTARYRVGNGTAGNIGAEALGHILSRDSGVSGVRNPLPARGGVDPETSEQVRQRAPSAFRTQERAVTAADYANVTQRDPRVQRAVATLRWTGSWHTVFVTVDPLGGREVGAPLERELVARLERYRMAGHDVEIDGPVFVALELDLQVCVRPDFFRADVRQALLELFSNRVLPGGRRGLFHPDRFSFGQPVYLSQLYAAAQSVPGVASVHISTFKRRGSVDNSAIDTGVLRLGRTEIAQLDNDRNFAERGVLRLTVGGGK